MKVEKETSNREIIQNSFLVCKNILYLTTSKIIIMCIIGVMTFFGASQLFNVLKYYTEDRSSVINAFTQGSDFNYQKSIPFKAELKTAVGNIIKYALVYQDVENFSASDSLQYHITDETMRANEQKKILINLAEYQVESGEYENDFIENGYIKFQTDSKGNKLAIVDREEIERRCDQGRDELIEGFKKASDSNYRDIKNYLDSLQGVYYAIDDHSSAIITNTGKTTSAQLQTFFSKTKDNLVIFNSRSPYYTTTTMLDYVDLVVGLLEDYEQNFDIYISFGEGLMFNEACKGIEQRCADMYDKVSACLVKAVIFTVIMVFLSVVLLLIAGKHEYKGATKYSITDKLPNDIHLLFHAITEISMVMLINNSIYIILNPHLGTTWLTVNPDYFIFRAELCFVIGVMVILAGLCLIKRHYKNKTLFTNTIVYRLLRVFLKRSSENDEQGRLM